MTCSLRRREFCERAWHAATLALAFGLGGCGEGTPTGPTADSPPPASGPTPEAPAPPPSGPIPPNPSGNVRLLAVVTARPIADGFTVSVSGSPLAEIWGSARAQVERAGIVRDVLLTCTGAETFVAVSGVCTHEGCIVSRVDRPVFVCPCHGSRYDHTGAVLRGPAAAALPRYETAFGQGLVTVYL